MRTAQDKIGEAVQILIDAQDKMEGMQYGYNVTGNMDAYVINYLQGGSDDIESKIEEYIDQTNELEFLAQ